jgi:Tol biopolymer transport system component
MLSAKISSLTAWALLLGVWAIAGEAWGQAPTPPTSAQESIEPRYLSHVRQITHDFSKAGEGYFSPDARQIVYQAVTKDYPFYQIYLQPLLTTSASPLAPQRISPGRGRTTCAFFHPDGQHLIYASSHLDPQLDQTEADARRKEEEDARSGRRPRYSWVFDPYMDIFSCDVQGKHLRPLTTTYGYDAEGSYSPDGKQIVFCSTRDGDPDLYIMDADGSHVRQLTNTPGYDGGPFFSPDGRWVVFRSDRQKPEYLQIYAISVDGQHEVALTDNLQTVNWAPYWHPTQPYIIWTGADHSIPMQRPNYDLRLMKYSIRDGMPVPGPITRVTDHPTADVLPVFSPDGKQLMWTSNRSADHVSQLWIADFMLPKE